METRETVEATQTRRRQRTIVIVIAAVALCCVCLVVAIAIYSWSSIRGGGADLFPVEDVTPSSPGTSLTPSFVPDSTFETAVPGTDAGEAPTGGLGNDILRNDTWQAVAAAATGQGCNQPLGTDSTIEVLQEPDANGVWLEKWTVVCESGGSYAYEVEYILDATGATFNVKSLP